MCSTSSSRFPAARSRVSASVWRWPAISQRPTAARSTFAAHSVAGHVSPCDFPRGGRPGLSVRPNDRALPGRDPAEIRRPSRRNMAVVCPASVRASLPGCWPRPPAQGWGHTELAGLVTAAEERSALWLVTPGAGRGARRRSGDGRRVRFVRSDQDLRSLVLTAAAARDHSVCLAGVSGRGRRADAIAAKLTSVGARVGRVEVGVADALDVGWAVELLIGAAADPRRAAARCVT